MDETAIDPDRTADAGEQAHSDRPALGPGAALGRYLVLDKIGAGAMGVVLAAFDPELDRKVAIKLLRGDAHTEVNRSRLLREAQSLARLGHPNVVAVHDVGEFDGRVYLVMEFIAGEDVWCWQRTRRSWREVMRVYVQAGHGLAAAHNAGLVHRDFKPANVMFGSDGRVRVTDFGLAREAPGAAPVDAPLELLDEASEPDSPSLELGESTSPSSHDRPQGDRGQGDAEPMDTQPSPPSPALLSEHTRAGAMVGTPAYMALEQFSGEPADGRSDQFAFCVAFYEALYGERPFAGDCLATLLTSVGDNNIRPAPRGVRVPGWLRVPLLRGLNSDPAQRWPSMDALLAAIERAPVKRRRWKATALTAALTIAGVTVGLMQAPDTEVPAETCSGAEDKLAEVWGSTDRERVSIAFTASERPYAADTLSRVERELDAYTRAWADMYVEACEATRVRSEQSEALLDQRMRCLERKRSEFSALVEALAGAGSDPAIIDRAVEAVDGLSPIELCGDLEALVAELAPDDQHTGARADELRDRLASAHALNLTGQVEAAEILTETLLDEAVTLGYAPLIAEVEYQLGHLVRQRGDFARSRELLERAYFTALGEDHERLAIEAAIELIQVLGSDLAETERAHDWIRNARALVHADDDNPLALAHIERYRVALMIQEGRYEEALTLGREALELIHSIAGPTSADAAALHDNVGAALIQLGRWTEAEIELRRASEIMEAQLGVDHPRVAVLLGNLGAVQLMTGRTSDAVATYSRSIDSLVRSYGSDHPGLGALRVNLSLARQIEGDNEAAFRELDEALRLFESQLGAVHPKVAAALRGQAELELELRHGRRAEAPARRALFVLESNFDSDHPDVARARVVLAQALLMQDRHDEAEVELALALATLESHDPPDAIRLAFASQVRGQLLLARDELDAADEQLERALIWWEPTDPSIERTLGLASTRLALARVCIARGEPEQAAELARYTLAEFEDERPDARLRRMARRLRVLTRSGEPEPAAEVEPEPEPEPAELPVPAAIILADFGGTWRFSGGNAQRAALDKAIEAGAMQVAGIVRGINRTRLRKTQIIETPLEISVSGNKVTMGWKTSGSSMTVVIGGSASTTKYIGDKFTVRARQQDGRMTHVLRASDGTKTVVYVMSSDRTRLIAHHKLVADRFDTPITFKVSYTRN